ncbi:MAG: DUF3088 domain-containing protein [Alphaproteobacteria bacterium]|nr:DUF3088 domain-containing protein [Alphaproteobacteria bacterium]MBU2082888.1 DUF3088 domain-containing protein [Alphaproteobacteria bacterium]MBU2142674.1 DUF3088 domain-containing protein [Alphaproteobacteria bacterium]MBU2196522.1 DUF3088 domain-containing protein [Alphaproteobacteria bacterium]
MSRKDQLFLLQPGFSDPVYPGDVFYCWHCALMEGLLASFPELAARVDVHRIAWPRPRTELRSLLGPDNQSCPVLILACGMPDAPDIKHYGKVAFIDDKDAILGALSDRHGIPIPHP